MYGLILVWSIYLKRNIWTGKKNTIIYNRVSSYQSTYINFVYETVRMLSSYSDPNIVALVFISSIFATPLFCLNYASKLIVDKKKPFEPFDWWSRFHQRIRNDCELFECNWSNSQWFVWMESLSLDGALKSFASKSQISIVIKYSTANESFLFIFGFDKTETTIRQLWLFFIWYLLSIAQSIVLGISILIKF